MASKLFSSEDWPLASRISEIVHCNPFEERRWELQRECLGNDYVERKAYVGPDEPEANLYPNVRQLAELAHGILEKARARLVAGCEHSADDRETYRRVVHFLLFHRFMDRFDATIGRSLEGNYLGDRIDFFVDYRNAIRYYLNVLPDLALDPQNEANAFAFCFQLRRAWLNTYRHLVGSSRPVVELRARIWCSAFTQDMARFFRSLYDRMGDIVTLITGPSGTGKELVARADGLSRYIPFDHRSMRFEADFHQAFYPLNLSALSPTLIESELFGHRKGSFTGALQDRKGYFEDCGSYGTVFLDEIGETDPFIQVKLLRVLQTRQFQRLGDTQLFPFFGKLMAATNRDLAKGIREGSFREDFFFRLNADCIQTPSLRELLDDSEDELPAFVAFISNRIAGLEDGPLLAEECCEWIRKRMNPEYSWPGNFRELEQCVRNILVHGSYQPEEWSESGLQDSLLDRATETRQTANQLLSAYAQALYREVGSYEETARILSVDRRTAKRYVLGVG